MNRQLLVLGFAILLAGTASCKRSDLYTVSIGRGPVTVIVVHGGPGLRHNYLRPEWDRVAAVARVTYYDQRGCGRSPRDGDLSVAQQLRDLDELVQAARASGPVILAGSSWGASLASTYAIRFPGGVAALILSGLGGWPRPPGEPMTSPPDSRPPQWHATPSIEIPVHAPLVTDSLQTIKDHPYLRPGIAKRLGEACLQAAERIVVDASRAFPPFDSLHTLQLPVLIVRGLLPGGGHDATPRYLSQLPAAVVLAVPGAGMSSWYDDPDLVFPAIARFIGTVSPLASPARTK